MHRLLGVLAAAALVLGIGAPAVLAADMAHTGRVVIAFNGPVDIPAGEHVDAVVVFSGDARIAGEANTIVVIDGTATLTGARAESIFVANGTVALDGSTTVLGDVRTLNSTVDRAPGATVGGSVKGIEAEIAALGIVLAPAFFLLMIGFALVTLAAALLVAALAARQVRAAEGLISREPALTLVYGLVGALGIPLVAIAAIATVVGAPLGLAVLLMVLPGVAYVGWLVASVWVGDWILLRVRGSVEPERPYLAAVVGVIVLGALGLFPPLSAIASLFGFGAVLLLAWRILRHQVLPAGQPMAAPAPLAG